MKKILLKVLLFICKGKYKELYKRGFFIKKFNEDFKEKEDKIKYE